ncbi:TPA: ATP-dependent DNA helicase RecQ [Enterococcus faecalis]|nr:ATP-dependent DNA helicase RecQ [Enterococcus faecalis]
MRIEQQINKKIEEITEGVISPIVILRGLPSAGLDKKDKYFSFTLENIDLLNIEIYRERVTDEIIDNRGFNSRYKWMTMEEYFLFAEQANINKNPIVILGNNLYDKQYPYQGTISNIENVYHYLYYQEDNELELDQEKLLTNVSLFYGKIDFSKESGKYYVTYPELGAKVEQYYLFDEIPKEVVFSEDIPKKDLLRIELSEDELPFLDMEEKILENDRDQNILLVLSGNPESLPNRYLERLNILDKISSINIFFATQSIRRQVIENEEAYIKVLKDVYGYDTYRNISFYKNIEEHNKETVEISQAQIIDDIVIQAEKAMHGEPFRDVYITASTGAGKSVMFQIPALYLAEKYKDDKPLTLVISPLIGLMNDQVDNMRQRGVRTSATINGNTPPFEKERVLERVQKQEIDVLYLSPETLQARSDIKMLIGERNIGVVIIDEAHIVTTWGKSFRADYWYLGIYLAKLRKEYKFPIVTFTATAIYGGKEDMYLDTRNSLNMISPISYFGDVRRDDILMKVKNSEKELDVEGRDYRKTKNTLALRHILNAEKKGQKSLLYFPTVRLLIDFYNFITQNAPEMAAKTGKYYGTLQKEEKDEVLSEFKRGELQFVLATKAFGMGIDIPDITNVYHYAPTGNVVDYIQEIGRAARDRERVPHGFGVIDFLPRDMNEVKQLHGMSAIRKNQILEVMRKVLSVYKEKGNNRNLIISPEDFKYIFVQNKRDEDSLDNKVKTVLLMIEKDFSSPNKLGYSPFVARPRSLFGNDLIFVTSDVEKNFVNSRLGKYFSKISDVESKTFSAIYQVNLSGIWEKYYKKMSFPSFKFSLFNAEEREKLQDKKLFEKFSFASGVEVRLSNEENTVENILAEYRIILQVFERFINETRVSGKFFDVINLGSYLQKNLKIADKFEARAFAQTLINSSFEFSKIKEVKFIAERTNAGDVSSYIIHQDGDMFTSFIMRELKNALQPKENFVMGKDEITSFNYRSRGDEIDAKIAALGIGEARKLLSFQVIGGNNPQIYLRMNSVYPLERAIKQGDFYQNIILQDVQTKHYSSVEMLKFLFTKKQSGNSPKEKILSYSKWFWDNIENYFMGILPNEVKATLTKDRGERG